MFSGSLGDYFPENLQRKEVIGTSSEGSFIRRISYCFHEAVLNDFDRFYLPINCLF